MKRLGGIAVVQIWLLFLLAVPSFSQETGSKQHNEDASAQPDARQQQQVESLLNALQSSNATLLEALRAIHTQAEAQAEQERAHYDGWCSPAVIVQIVLVLVGVGYTMSAWRQLGAIQTQANIANETLIETRKAANAADKSANAAHSALLSDRPYLLVDNAELERLFPDVEYAHALRDSDYKPLQIHFRLTNYGKGPAVIDKVLLRLKMVEPNAFPPAKDYTDCLPLRVKGPSDWRAPNFKKIIAADKPFDCRTDEAEGPSGQKTHDIVQSGTETVIGYGVIYYRDVAGHPYETGFCWVYDPSMGSGSMYAHPEANNYST